MRRAVDPGDDADPRAASVWPDSGRGSDPTPIVSAWSSRDPRFEPGVGPRDAATFDVCHPAVALRAVAGVQVAAAVVAMADAASVADALARLAPLAFGALASTLAWLVALCALQRPLRRGPAPARVAAAPLLGAASAVVVGWAPLAAIGLVDATALRGTAAALGGAGAAAVVDAWIAARARQRRPVDAAARLAELQSRIRPHFLFNALNTALALVRADPARAEAVLEDLAELFRVALAETGASVSLADELDLTRRYLAIEQIRFGDRLAVQWHVDRRAGAARVPPLVLQPLVENAVRHGVEPSPTGGEVALSAAVQRGQVVVELRNTVAAGGGEPGHGIALVNVRERLRLLHDVAAQFDTWRDGDGFHVRVVLPAP